MELPDEGRARVVIENVSPEIDCGRFPAKRIRDEPVEVQADAFVDGHEALTCLLLYRHASEAEWRETPMEELVNDRWRGAFQPDRLGRYRYTILARVDTFATWRRDLGKRIAADQDVSVDLEIGAQIIHAAAARAESPNPERKTSSGKKSEGAKLHASANRLANTRISLKKRISEALDPELAAQVGRYPDRSTETRYARELEVVVDRPRARFSSWYEVFPRSCGPEGRHGTFADLESRLPRIAEMGFDVLYLPPIHPIGRVNRKGKNNARTAMEGDVGSPWAIGSAEGGAHGRPPPPGNAGRLPAHAPSGRGARNRGRARHRLPGGARPSMGRRASGMVPGPAGRNDPVRGESSQEVPGYLSLRFRLQRVA